MKPAGPVFDRSWRESCEIVFTRVRQDVHSMILNHYLGKWPGVTVLILFLRRHQIPLGCIVFALPPRETATRYGCVTWELARLWMDDAVPKNAESFLIGAAVKWIKKNRPHVGALVSYADPSRGHQGTIYKAANWTADGKTDDGRKTPRFDYRDAKTKRMYSRRAHVPEGVQIERVPRVSKYRYIMRLHPAPCASEGEATTAAGGGPK